MGRVVDRAGGVDAEGDPVGVFLAVPLVTRLPRFILRPVEPTLFSVPESGFQVLQAVTGVLLIGRRFRRVTLLGC